MTLAKNIAKHLLDVKAVTLSPNEPYTWASGLKSPIYCDNRITMSYPETRNTIAQGFAQQIQAIHPEVDYIVGTATAGIPQACWVADILSLPMAYVRPKPKDHGKSKQIEGFIPRGAKVVVIEDLISTGGSCIKACEALRVEGIEVLGVMAVFTYELESAKINFDHANIALTALSNYTTLVEIASEQNYITPADVTLLQSWKNNPQTYGKE